VVWIYERHRNIQNVAPGTSIFKWDEKWSPGHYIGATHTLEEQVGTELFKVRIKFYDPTEVFDGSRFQGGESGGSRLR